MTQPAPKNRRSRRQFIVTSAGAGLAIGLHLPGGSRSALAQTRASDSGVENGPPAGAFSGIDAPEVGAWVVIKPDDTCVIRIARSEMGQGTRTGLAQLVAEELECDWRKVTTESPTPGQNLARKRVWRDMATGGSRGIRGSQEYVRQGGAAARMMLMQAAAAQWQVPVSELTVSAGVISHSASSRSISYGKIAAAASRLTPPDPKDIKLKSPTRWSIAGRALPRVDTFDKTNGSKIFTADVKLPGLLNAAIKACPVFGGKLKSFDESKVAGMPGVRKVLRVHDNAVAVVADTWWRAKTALDVLPIEWDEGANAARSSAQIDEHIRSGLSADNPYAMRDEGNASAAIAGAVKKIEALYGTPFLAHATMEPHTAVVRISAEKAEMWLPTQNGEASLAALSEESGLPLARCEIYKHDLGGGFGRRGGSQDYARQAVAIAKQMPGVPVKLIWSREEDLAHDFFRPISQCKLSAGIDEQGALIGLQLRVSGQSLNAFSNPASIIENKDNRQLQGYYEAPGDAQLGYTIPNLRVEYVMRNTHVPVGPWRGVNTNQNGVYFECFLDEAARAAGKDPLEFRRVLMSKHPKHLEVLNAAARNAGWNKKPPAGVHRGIAQFMGYGSYSAAVAEVSMTPEGKVKVLRMVLALNCGHAVNPQQIEAQVQGSVAYGLSATFYGENTVKDGRMVESNFHQYKLLKIAEMPKVETVILPSFDFWGGVGEPTICVVAPAVMNAIHAATGKPVRTLPLKNLGLV